MGSGTRQQDHVLVVGEMPGINKETIKLELKGDLLTISAEKGAKKYRKEVSLPQAFSSDKMSYTCGEGIVQVRLGK